MKINGKTIVVTGGGSGMGRQLVIELLRRGASVAAADLNEAALNETARMANGGSKLSLHVLNLADKAAVDALPAAVIEKHGSVDGIINNAGIIQPFIKIQALDMATIEKVMQVNFYGTLYMIKAFLPYLLQRPDAHIVNISSMGGFLPVPGQSIYGASKAAVKLMSEGLQAELADTAIKVTVVFPGAIDTNIMANSGIDTSKIENSNTKNREKLKPLAADKAAAIIIEGMEKNKIRLFVGKDSRFLDKLYRLSPGYATRMVAGQMKSLLD